MISNLRKLINAAKRDYPGCKICGPVKFSDHNKYYVRDQQDKLLDTIIEVN